MKLKMNKKKSSKKVKKLISGLALIFSVTVVSPSYAICHTNGMPGTMVSNLCWACFFPITIAGVPVGTGTSVMSVPHAAASQLPFCACPKVIPPGFVVMVPGTPMGGWSPSMIIEAVHTPGCSPTLGGAILPIMITPTMGLQDTEANAQKEDQIADSFYNVHIFPSPIQNYAITGPCEYSVGHTVAYTEIDPLWNNGRLAFFQTPEALAQGNPISQLACSADAVAAAVDQPLDALFWCVGSWGTLFPLTGTTHTRDPIRTTSLAATREIATLHRRFMASMTMGPVAMCKGAHPFPALPKTQYRMGMFFPIPEVLTTHPLGRTPYLWESMTFRYPLGEYDSTYIGWQWYECCRTWNGY